MTKLRDQNNPLLRLLSETCAAMHVVISVAAAVESEVYTTGTTDDIYT